MSELNSIIDFLEGSEIKDPPTDGCDLQLTKECNEENNNRLSEKINVFNIQKFGQELYHKSEEKNKERALRPNQNITGYDISQNCIMHILFKLRNTPIQNYVDSWLPIYMRTEVGKSVHEFIQKNTNQFTEVEVNLKVPSIQFYGKIDYMIGSGLLGEIKTCTYDDYSKILKKQQPREKDFLQAITYHYILHKYLDEAKSSKIKFCGENPPLLSNYDVKKIQFIYVSHDLISSQAETYAEMLEKIKDLKRTLDSKRNPFFFITSLVVDLDKSTIEKFYEYIENKFLDIHHYMRTNTNPVKESRYVNMRACFFCPYKPVCKFNRKM